MKQTEFYFHGQTTEKKGISPHKFTIAVTEEGSNLCVAISLCSHADRFNKKLGCLIAKGRLNKSKKIHFVPKSENSIVRSLLFYGALLCKLPASELKPIFGL